MLELVQPSRPERVVRVDDVLEGRYRLQRIIGEGGMGTVFLAEHVLIKRRVAIKVLRPDLARDADVVERFMNEARAAGTLGHPNIVESTDMGFARNELPYIVFEYLEGALLADEVYRLGGLAPRRALKIAHQVASALEAAHRAGIVHRDLKTDNVFLTDKDDALDHVKVLDFGISRFVEAGQERTGGKRAGVLMGTPEFMAPEQITAPDTVDARADIYALGVVLYEMLAARTPFVNENKADPHELLHRIILDKPPPLTREGLPAGLADMILDKLLAKDPDARYQTMGDVQGALDAFISVMKRDTQPVMPPAALTVSLDQTAENPEAKAAEAVRILTPVMPKASRRWAGWLGLAAALVIGSGAATWIATQREHQASAGTTENADGVAATPDDQERAIEQLAAALDNLATAAELRAQGVATSPMLRAAIETDAATLEDLAREGNVFHVQSGETLEIVQLRDGRATTLLRLPAGALPLVARPERSTLVIDAVGARVVVAAPILDTANTVGGSLVLAAAVDLRALAPSLAGRGNVVLHTKKLGELTLAVGPAGR
jgi:tRNA A-37 threonylcarbamoyl transferase component Bud32